MSFFCNVIVLFFFLTPELNLRISYFASVYNNISYIPAFFLGCIAVKSIKKAFSFVAIRVAFSILEHFEAKFSTCCMYRAILPWLYSKGTKSPVPVARVSVATFLN